MSEADRVLEVNTAFYRAVRLGDYRAMDRLWARRRQVACVHPAGPALTGRRAVMESWRMILVDGVPPGVHPGVAQAIVTGGSAMVLCHELIGDITLMASNTFVREDGDWRMLSHQAAHFPGTVR